MKPSKYHKNKNVHNWLIYSIADKYIDKFKHLYKGDLIDLGCGELPYKDYFLQYVDSYIGVDWSKTLHDSKADVIADLNKELNLADACADTIISFSVMEHLCEPQLFLNESFRILKPNGNMILQLPWQWHIHEAPYDYFRYSPYGLKYMFKKAGFSHVKIIPQSGFFSAQCIKWNYFLARLIYKSHALIKYPFALLFLPFWTLGQILAPLFDKLDKHWEVETLGYMVIASKK